METSDRNTVDKKTFDKNTFDAWMALAEGRRQHREARRAIEWQVSFALWALLIATSYYMRDVLRHQDPNMIAGGLTVLALGHIFLWVLPNRLTNHSDTGMMAAYRREAEALLDTSPLKNRSQQSGWSVPQFFFQILVTVGLSVGVFLVLIASTPEVPPAASCAPAAK